MPNEGHWVPVREAADACCIAERTLYAKVKSKSIAARKIRGVLQVNLAEVHELAASRAAAPVAGSAGNGTAIRAGDSPAILSAKERLAAKSLEAEELRASVTAERTREELVAAEVERRRRQELVQIEIERQRLGLEREQEQIAEERARREEQTAAEQRHRGAEADKARRKREQEREARERAEAHRKWTGKWASTAAAWMRDQLGVPALVPEAIALANAILSRCSLDEPEAVVFSLLRAAFDREFAPTIEKREREALQQSRVFAAQRAAADLANRWGPAVHERVLRATLDAAELVDPRTDLGQQWVRDAAQRELDAWRAQRALGEQAAQKQRDREREEAARQRQKLDDEERAARRIQAEGRKREEDDREWARIARSLGDIVVRELPRGANQSERDEAEAILGCALESRGEAMQPYQFAGTASSALRALVVRVEARQREDEKRRKWATFVEDAVAALRREVPPEATERERTDADARLRHTLKALEEDGAALVSFSARSDLVNAAAIPIWRRLAVDRAVGDVKEELPDELVLKAYRAAVRDTQSEQQRYQLQRAAYLAVAQVVQEYQFDKTLRSIRSAGQG